MKSKKSKNSFVGNALKDLFDVFRGEFVHVFKDSGVMIIFFFAGILYPLLYNGIYKNEYVYQIPIAVVDESSSAESREFIRKVNATREVEVAYKCINLEEAKELFNQRKVHGVIYIPRDYHVKLRNMEQATISIYNDMSSFLYYKGLMMSVNYTMLDESHKIQIERYNSAGVAGEQAEQIVKPIPYNDVVFYNPGNGFTSFLIPAILVLIIHQTLFFGIGMLAGTAREENRHHTLVPEHLRGNGIFRVIIGKALCYFVIYAAISAYVLGFVPKLFGLPHIGNIWTLFHLLVPFLFATIFFSMTISVFVKNRETGLITFLFFTLILLFLSGFSWPRSNMPTFWVYVSYLFPSTHGIQGYIKINTMAAELRHVRFEYIGLWIQTGVYFILASGTLLLTLRKEKKRLEQDLD